MAQKYFLYSASQFKFRKEQEARMGKSFIAGQVIVKGKRKPFTELSSSNSLPRFPDSIVIAYEDTDLVKYTLPRSE